ncbi:hypothetical protein M2140_001652 [Clostridiales Family XIII bacterium PM5-7]
MNVIISKFKEVLFSVLPITILVIFLNFTISPLGSDLMIRFLIGSLLVIIGLTVFLIGVDIGITPLGDLTGVSLAKTNKLWIMLAGGLVLGFFISIAEPGLMVLANQVNEVTSGAIPGTTILIIVSIGLAIMLAIGFLRIFYSVPLYKMLLVLYAIILGLSIFASREFLAIAFDASGSTTGILAVPFILALSVGISKLKKDSKASEKDSFGLVAVASTGAIMSVLLLDIFSDTKEFASSLETVDAGDVSILNSFLQIIPTYLKESFMAILPLLLILLALQQMFFKLPKRELRRMLVGFGFAFVGLFVFMIGVNAGFMDVGTSLGNNLALMDNKVYIVAFGLVLGIVTILAEPAVYVLTQQIETVTSGYVKRFAVLIPLALGVGAAVALSVIRVLVPEIQLWHYLVPGYAICLALMFITPKLFVGIAFDAGGVATGPVTATFILAFIQGAASAFEGADIMADGFGMIAMVAMMPIITLEIMGLIFKVKSKKKGEVVEYV